jgi:hypothetical protein
MDVNYNVVLNAAPIADGAGNDVGPVIARVSEENSDCLVRPINNAFGSFSRDSSITRAKLI